MHQIQNSRAYHGPFGVALDGSPDFETIAAAYGIPSIVVHDEDEVDGCIERMLNTPGCVLTIVNVHPDVTTND